MGLRASHGSRASRRAATLSALYAGICAVVLSVMPAEHVRAQPLAQATAATNMASGEVPARYAAARQRVLVVGDSLSAEYGLARGSGWVALLDKRIAERKMDAAVANASISGDTTSGGLARLQPLLARYKPTLVIIELGGNDALRGLSLSTMQSNLSAMVRASKAAGAKVLLVGMQIPPNYGRKFADDFAAVYARVAQDEKVALVPFFLAGVADAADPTAQFQADRIHPVASAHPRMLENVWAQLGPLLQKS